MDYLRFLFYFIFATIRDSILYGGIIGLVLFFVGESRGISISVFEVIGVVFCIFMLHFILFSRETLYSSIADILNDDEEDKDDE